MNQKQAERERERGFRDGEWDVGVMLLLIQIEGRTEDDTFGCQQLWDPDIWSNIILVVLMRVS